MSEDDGVSFTGIVFELTLTQKECVEKGKKPNRNTIKKLRPDSHKENPDALMKSVCVVRHRRKIYRLQIIIVEELLQNFQCLLHYIL